MTPGRRLQLSVRLPPCKPITEIAAAARLAEDLGFDGVAVPDSPMLWRDPFATLALIALQTERVHLTLAVSNFASRDPYELASAGRTVSELAPGRFRMGIGVGDSAVTLTGRRRVSGSQLLDGVARLASLISGDNVAAEAGHRDVLHDTTAFPIYIAADGPRNLARAAANADGVLTSHADSARKHEVIARVAADTSKPVPRHIAMGLAWITDDPARDARMVKPFALRAAQIGGTQRFAEAGFTLDVPTDPIRMPDGTDLGHVRDREAAVEFASQWIDDDVALWFASRACLFGSADEVVTKLHQLAADGVDEVVLHGGESFRLPIEMMERLAQDVLPRL